MTHVSADVAGMVAHLRHVIVAFAASSAPFRAVCRSLTGVVGVALLSVAAPVDASAAAPNERSVDGGQAVNPSSQLPPVYSGKLWVTVGDLQSRVAPEVWAEVVHWADRSVRAPVLHDRNDDADVALLAAAFVARRGHMDADIGALQARVLAAMGSEVGPADGDGDGESLALARNLPALLIAANLLEIDTVAPEFRRWVRQLAHKSLGTQQRSLVSTHEARANNWGTHAGAARIAIAVYLGDTEELDAAARVFRGWLGDRTAYAGFDFKRDRSWQANRNAPVGINPSAAKIDGRDVDGVLPDDQRRGGEFGWPPVREQYVWEALQGAVVQAQLLADNGYDAWEWSDRALLRAVRWLMQTAEFPPSGDDVWILPLIDSNYGTQFSLQIDTTTGRPGKNVGFTRFSHEPRAARRALQRGRSNGR